MASDEWRKQLNPTWGRARKRGAGKQIGGRSHS